ncbi:hypothetical protein GCM10009682_61180 [Luedemannella flava]|uniref:Segregation and condensation protein B n=1 Tax=Luedemannella flava TaxID=349316 RepID=A0ABN2MPT6_9ACTN
MNDERPQSLAESAASWVPPWARQAPAEPAAEEPTRTADSEPATAGAEGGAATAAAEGGPDTFAAEAPDTDGEEGAGAEGASDADTAGAAAQPDTGEAPEHRHAPGEVPPDGVIELAEPAEHPHHEHPAPPADLAPAGEPAVGEIADREREDAPAGARAGEAAGEPADREREDAPAGAPAGEAAGEPAEPDRDDAPEAVAGERAPDSLTAGAVPPREVIELVEPAEVLAEPAEELWDAPVREAAEAVGSGSAGAAAGELPPREVAALAEPAEVPAGPEAADRDADEAPPAAVVQLAEPAEAGFVGGGSELIAPEAVADDGAAPLSPVLHGEDDAEGAAPAALSDAELRGALEAVLLVVDEPVGEFMLAQVLDEPAQRVAATLTDLRAEYAASGRGFELRQAAGGWRLYTRTEYAAYVERFVLDGQQTRLTQAALETLAVIAYKQPVTRSRISAIRGVNCDGVIKTLVARGLVEECGTERESGALLYQTTPLFLEKLGINSVAELPGLAPFLPENVDDIDAHR